MGRRIAFPARNGEAEWLTIVGVASDLLASVLDREQIEAVYRPLAQDVPMSFQAAVRSDTSPTVLVSPIREAVAEIDSDVALFDMRTLEESINLANGQYGWTLVLLVAGGLALFLTAIGLYGVMAFWVAQRTGEIGVRMAMGGARAAIVALVLRQGATQIALGLVVGGVLAVPVAWLLQGALFEVQPFDTLVFGGVVGVLVGAGWLGCLLPVLRATRVDPLVALTAE